MSMEIVIATTYAERAEWMRGHLVGHTMSGESLERRPQVQYTGALDFLEAALKLYEITAIRLEPKDERVEVIAEYRPCIFHCEICGAECSAIPRWIAYDLEKDLRRSWCSPECKQCLEQRMWDIRQAYRASLGDPVEAALEYLRYRQPVPDKLFAALSMKEWEQDVHNGCHRMYKGAKQDLFSVLYQRCVEIGADMAEAPHVSSLPSSMPPERSRKKKRVLKKSSAPESLWSCEGSVQHAE
jgi:hypothetical protein